MTDLRKAAEMALEALHNIDQSNNDDAIEALRAALTNEFNPDWDSMAVMVEEQQRMAKRIEELTQLVTSQGIRLMDAEAQPEQEPVAWMHIHGDHQDPCFCEITEDEISRGWTQKPLYYAAPTLAPLGRKSFGEVHPRNPNASCKCEHWQSCAECHPTAHAQPERYTTDAMKIKQAVSEAVLKHAVQEPIAYLCENAVGHRYFRWKKPSSEYKPIALYTAHASPQRIWQGLTEEEIIRLRHLYDTTAHWSLDMFARAIEAKLKEKNG